MKKGVRYHDHYEELVYDGHTMIERVRRFCGKRVRRDWLIFDSVEDAESFFNDI